MRKFIWLLIMMDRMEKLKSGILSCFDLLIKQDSNLFENPLEIEAPYDVRKLHEVCINHRLATYFENIILPDLKPEKYYVDIEFNREGINFKKLRHNGQEDLVRPDVIIHNRRSGAEKKNLLVVECKKENAPESQKTNDMKKLEAFITDKNYSYNFGLQVIYGKQKIKGILVYLNNSEIVKVALNRD